MGKDNRKKRLFKMEITTKLQQKVVYDDNGEKQEHKRSKIIRTLKGVRTIS